LSKGKAAKTNVDFMASELVLVKLGGSLITDKTAAELPRSDEIKRLAREVHAAKQEGNLSAVIGHGGGSFPHRPAHKYGTANGFHNADSAKGVAEVQHAASRLNRIVVRALLDAGEDAVSFSPSSFMVTSKGKPFKVFLEPMKIALAKGITPVPYGDVTLDDKQGCAIVSTEMVLESLAKKFKAKRIVIASKEDGVWKDYPQNTELVEEISPKNYSEVRKSLSGSHATDVTGGMLSKVDTLLGIAKRTKVEIIIINGLVPGRLRDAMLGKKAVGTKITG
jgi:isopentenyl phosphate kinase